MGIMEGLLKGFSTASTENRRQQMEADFRQSDLEQRIFSTLASSDDPEIQQRAVQAMMASASGKGKKKGGIDALFGPGGKPSPALGDLFSMLSGRPGPTSGQAKTTAEMPGGSMVEVPPGGNTPAADIPGGTTTVTATPPSPGAGPIFKSPEQRRLEANASEREALTSELGGLGATTGETLEGVYGIRQPSQTMPNLQSKEILLPDGTPGLASFDPISGLYLDPTTGQPIQGARPYEPPTPEMSEYQRQSLALQGRRVSAEEARVGRLGQSTTPRDREAYLNAQAALDSIDRALEAEFSKLQLTGVRTDAAGEINRRRDELARQFGFQNYQDVLTNSAIRRGEGEVPLSTSPPAPSGIMGDPFVDDQRMEEIVLKERQGMPLTAEEIAFAQQYQAAYSGGR